MSIYFSGGPALEYVGFPNVAYPFSMGGWFKVSYDGTHCLMAFSNQVQTDGFVSATIRPKSVGPSVGNVLNTSIEALTHRGSHYTTVSPDLASQWVHVLFTNPAVDSHFAYVNGRPSGFNRSTATISYTFSYISVGAGPPTAGNRRGFVGKMDGWAVWNVALNPTEAYQLGAMRQNPLSIRRNAHLGCWSRMNLNESNQVPDYSGNGYHLSIQTGTPTTSLDTPNMVSTPTRRRWLSAATILRPNGIAARSRLAGAYTDIDDSVLQPDSNWLTYRVAD